MEYEAIHNPDHWHFEIVDRLPSACGGAVGMRHDDGTIWVLVEQPDELLPDPPPAETIDSYLRFGLNVVEQGEPITATDVARHFDTPVEVVQAAGWATAWDWWSWSVTDRSLN